MPREGEDRIGVGARQAREHHARPDPALHLEDARTVRIGDQTATAFDIAERERELRDVRARFPQACGMPQTHEGRFGFGIQFERAIVAFAILFVRAESQDRDRRHVVKSARLEHLARRSVPAFGLVDSQEPTVRVAASDMERREPARRCVGENRLGAIERGDRAFDLARRIVDEAREIFDLETKRGGDGLGNLGIDRGFERSRPREVGR